jgi:predicted nucleotidyltransferase
MRTAHIELPEDKLSQFCRKWNVKEFSLFGSVLRDDFKDSSDIDILVTFQDDAEPSLFDLVRMEMELKEMTGKDVDLVSRRGIEMSRNYIRKEAILSSAEPIYAS